MATTNSFSVAVIPDRSDNGQDAYRLTLEVQKYALRAIDCHGGYDHVREIVLKADAAIKALDRFSQSL